MTGPSSTNAFATGRARRGQPPVQLKVERADVGTLLFGGIVGLLLGLLIGWVIWPVEWTGVLPVDLEESHRYVYLQMVADSYVTSRNANEAMQRLSSWSASQALADLESLRASLDAQGRFEEASRVNALVSDLSLPALAAAEPTRGIGLGDILVTILYSLLAALLIVAGIFGFRYVYMQAGKVERRPKPAVSGAVAEQPGAAPVSPPRYPQELPGGSGHKMMKPPPTSAPVGSAVATQEHPPTQAEALAEAVAVQTFTARYNLGDVDYDELFTIEFKPGEYAGECGMAVSESLSGDALKVTALEVWLFDKSHIRTVTAVLMSEHAYEDSNLRSRLETKGDLLVARPGERFKLEAEALEVTVHLQEVEYAEPSDAPPQSVFQSVVAEFMVRPRVGRMR